MPRKGIFCTTGWRFCKKIPRQTELLGIQQKREIAFLEQVLPFVQFDFAVWVGFVVAVVGKLGNTTVLCVEAMPQNVAHTLFHLCKNAQVGQFVAVVANGLWMNVVVRANFLVDVCKSCNGIALNK